MLGGTALVTGATGGLGAAIARALSARGAGVVLSGRRRDALEPLAAELRGRAVVADLAAADGPERLVAEVGSVDVLVANAGLPASGPVTDFSLEEIDRALAVNLRAPMALARLLVPGMVQRGGGHLVFVSSLSGKVAAAGSAVYSATKFGLRGFAHGLRQDLRGSGVGVSTVFPGFIRDAGMFADTEVELPPGTGTRSPAEVGDAVVRAVERDLAEVDVASVALRASTVLAAIAPELTAALGRRLGAERVAGEMAAAQRGKR